MKTMISAGITGLLAGVLLASPVLAAADTVCIQRNRIMSWQAHDERTLIVTDRFYNRYTVEVTPGCHGATAGNAKFVIPVYTSLGCVRIGDFINVSTPHLGLTTCTVSAIHAGVPAPADAPAPG